MKPVDRMKKYGYIFYGGAENICVNKNDAFSIILSLMIDDGVPTRGHRLNIFN